MDNVDRLATAKKLLCNEIMAATSAFDLAKSLWDAAGLECRSHRLSALSGMMPVLAVFETIPDGKLYYKKLDPNTATEWNNWNTDREGSFSIFDDWMGAKEVEASLAMVKHNIRYLRDHDRDRESGRQYVCLADPEWLRYEYEGDALRKAVYQSLDKTGFMLDELGNLQSEGHGIEDFETILSIGLGKGYQFTLIDQSVNGLEPLEPES